MRTALLSAVCLLLPALAAANGDGQAVDITAPDGLVLKGTLYEPDAPGPGVLMLHQCNRDRHSWDTAALALEDAGFFVLTMDFRGFGESVGRDVHDFHEQSTELWPMFDGDVDRAYDFLRAYPGVDGTRIGAIGASCGGSQAMLLALRYADVKAVVFLSSGLPWIDEEDLVLFEKNRTIPLLTIAAEGDRGTTERGRRVFESSRHPDSRLILYKGDEHGVPLFRKDSSLIGTIVGFFADNL